MEDDILQEFLAESWENLGRLDTEIVQLEREPKNSDLLGSIFRTIHTIKGTCGFIGLTRLGHVAHSAENVLGRMRDLRLDVSPAAISMVLDGIDRIKELLAGLEANGAEPELDSSDLIHRLDLLASLGDPVEPSSSKEKTSAPPSVDNEITNQVDEEEFSDLVKTPPAVMDISEVSSVPEANEDSEPQSGKVSSVPSETQVPPGNKEIRPAVSTPNAEVLGSSTMNEIDQPAGDGRKSVADLSIRVNVDVLDLLMNLVGELVLTRNQLLQLVRGEDESRYAAPIALLNRVTTDLQEGVMKTRMQPIGNAWSKLPRLVRDLCKITGKQVELEMIGAATELDRTVLDAIKDPLTHMVRNSVDHGVESPAVRRSVGKPEQGLLKLQAYHEGGHVVICIEDNGKGIDRNRVLRKAIDQGIVSDSEAAKLTEAEIDRLIFRPGFSTAEQITAVSGRGVGMDVVRTEIERIGGTVDLSSTPGQGTSVRIKIPLTLAIISALVVESGGIHFAIPQLGVVELVRVPAEELHRIERIRNQQVLRLRNRLLPLVELRDILNLNQDRVEEARDTYIVVVQVADEQLGLIVSEVFDTQEIVVKPVGRLLKDVPVYQGTTILGDGRVIMILDVAGIAGRFSKSRPEASKAVTTRSESSDQLESTSLLIFAAEDGLLQAVPLGLVSRLEEFQKDTIERSGDRMLVQYRGQLLPLMNLADSRTRGPSRDLQPVVVFSDDTNALGLLVDQIRDITEQPLIIRSGTKRPGTLGTAIIDGKAIDVVDTQYYLIQANPQWFQREAHDDTRRVLVVAESLFFRQLVRTACESAGWLVNVVDSVERAENSLDHHGPYHAIVCDVDGKDPRLSQFADWTCRGAEVDQRRVVALTGVNCPEHVASLKACGCDAVLAKFDARELTNTLQKLTRQATQLSGVES